MLNVRWVYSRWGAMQWRNRINGDRPIATVRDLEREQQCTGGGTLNVEREAQLGAEIGGFDQDMAATGAAAAMDHLCPSPTCVTRVGFREPHRRNAAE